MSSLLLAAPNGKFKSNCLGNKSSHISRTPVSQSCYILQFHNVSETTDSFHSLPCCSSVTVPVPSTTSI